MAGARTIASIPPDVLIALNEGTREAKTLAESLAVNFAVLLNHVSEEAQRHYVRRVAPKEGIKKRMELASRVLLDVCGLEAVSPLMVHTSDTVRGWAAYMLGLAEDMTLKERLLLLLPLADDPNAGVREWAWMAVRGHIAEDIHGAIETLVPWTAEESANLRRFAVESTRPRGVWCTHISILKENPSLGLPLLEPLRADPAKYVQDAVSNWLNDAAKSQPAWVQMLCDRWREESADSATERICKRALRSVGA